jgi:hypothetical protein
MPLAVELAAGLPRVLAPAQILDRLGQRLDLLKGDVGRSAARRVARRLDADLENLRSAISWARNHDGRLELELRKADVVA